VDVFAFRCERRGLLVMEDKDRERESGANEYNQEDGDSQTAPREGRHE
jgi:hypothetical protein